MLSFLAFSWLTIAVAVPVQKGCTSSTPAYSVAVGNPHGMTRVGGNITLQGLVADGKGHVFSDCPVKWSSSNSRVATVDSRGSVKGIAKGSATITAAYKGKSGIAGVVIK
jgi:uncharacterized protein YjdB